MLERQPFFVVEACSRLLSDSEFFFRDDCAVAFDVDFDQIVEKATTLADKAFKSSSCVMIFVI